MSAESMPQPANDPVLAYLQEHPALFLAGLTTATFVMKVWVAAAADPAVALGIVAASGSLELAVSLLILFFPVLTITATLALIIMTLRYREGGRPTDLLVVVTASAVVLTLYVTPIGLVVGFVWAMLMISAIVTLLARRERRVVNLTPRTWRAWLFGYSFLLLSQLVGPSLWLPPENYTLFRGDTPTVGYFVEEDGPWLTVLQHYDRRLARLRAQDVRTRDLCSFADENTFWTRSIVGVLTRPEPLEQCASGRGSA